MSSNIRSTSDLKSGQPSSETCGVSFAFSARIGSFALSASTFPFASGSSFALAIRWPRFVMFLSHSAILASISSRNAVRPLSSIVLVPLARHGAAHGGRDHAQLPDQLAELLGGDRLRAVRQRHL